MEKIPPSHFAGKEAIKHVSENYVKGIIASSEIHGAEIPGAISALADAAKETATVFLLFWTIFHLLNIPQNQIFLILGSFFLGFILWRAGRSAILGWARLERLHRIAAQEKWEIQHNRSQEREELTALYRAKGFQGKLLKDVMDVLMSDEDILLRVMLEEELGLSLEVHEHPLKQAFGAFFGVFIGFLVCSMALYFFPNYGPIFGSCAVVSSTAILSAKYEQNDLIHAFVWNLGLILACFGVVYFLTEYLIGALK